MKAIKKIIVFIFVLLLGVISLYIYKGYNMYKDAINEVNLETKVNEIKLDNDYVTIEYLPDKYLQAVVDLEDHRFYEHSGIDIVSIFRALLNNLKEKKIVEGGSSITQQLAKNIYFSQEQELARKIAEVFVVVELEENYEKDEILELYVNVSYFGDGYYGIGQATRGYFNKEPIQMTLNECTLLAGVPNAPSVYAPTKNPQLASERQKHVINRMIEKGHLTEEEANDLLE